MGTGHIWKIEMFPTPAREIHLGRFQSCETCHSWFTLAVDFERSTQIHRGRIPTPLPVELLKIIIAR